MGILIVDDSPDQQALLRSILLKAGHADVLTAVSAKGAGRVLNLGGDVATQKIDLILMDVLMPEQDGVETCRQIKRCAHLEDIPVIMVTAKSDLSNLQDAFAAAFGAADEVVLAAVFRSSLPDSERLDADRLIADLRARGKQARHIANNDDIVSTIVREHRDGDVVVLMSNGGFGGIHRALLRALHDGAHN